MRSQVVIQYGFNHTGHSPWGHIPNGSRSKGTHQFMGDIFSHKVAHDYGNQVPVFTAGFYKFIEAIVQVVSFSAMDLITGANVSYFKVLSLSKDSLSWS